ncbi:alpha/beta fold hydrolase [Mucilaginibacter sp. E4BP6]|uniref:alpha/beta fold hydrolase n=1 Tax=Mucilaginibacter sp. E4BP6 TaxID=2723089 RepID=UPI0015CBEBDE|nr:alpha/beta hydrolase [Mucilaginibacter sp. E4BP6]NYE65080.1 pimeloyl-ACP methyl ester carboxylesterase [Mucilaginibacter sp. E4BP6]
MKKHLIILFALQLVVLLALGQEKPIPYGNNPAVGRYYDIRGFKMYCEVYGTGKPLLMIHGNGGDISAFTKNIPYFSKKYMVIVADSRAQGKSVDGRDSLSFEMMADDFAALLDAMHIKSSYVIGWSDGGINALLLAMRHPEKVVRLASTGANLWPDSTALIPSEWKGERDYYDANKNKTFTTAKEKNDWKIFMLDWLQPNVPLSALKQINCPSLIISGDHDLIVLQHTVLIYQNIPHAYLWILPDSPHHTLKAHADEFNKKVDEFFTKPFHNWN